MIDAAQHNLTYILYFDGTCNLCNHFINFMVERNGRSLIKIASLQGETAKIRLPKEHKKLNTVVLQTSTGMIYTQSSAVLRAMTLLSGFWYLLAIFLVVPVFIRNAIYNYVAQNRYKWFGQKNHCRWPTPEERSYFLP